MEPFSACHGYRQTVALCPTVKQEALLAVTLLVGATFDIVSDEDDGDALQAQAKESGCRDYAVSVLGGGELAWQFESFLAQIRADGVPSNV